MQPKDIENFALASKTIRILAGKVLVDHRKLTRELSTFYTDYSESRFSAAGWLKEILTNPRVALYIKTVVVDPFFRAWQSEEGVNTLKTLDPKVGGDERQYRHTPYAKEDVELFASAIGRARPFVDFKHKKLCQFTEFKIRLLRRRMKEGDEFPIIWLLVLLSTNLKTIVTERDSVAGHSFFKLLRYISEGNGVPILKQPIKVKIMNVRGKTVEFYLRRLGPRALPSSTDTDGKIPGTVSDDHCFSFDLRAWSMNVDGM